MRGEIPLTHIPSMNMTASDSLQILTETSSMVPDDQFIAVSSFFIMLPLAWLIKYFKDAKLKMTYSLIAGVLLQFYLYRESMLHVVFAAVVNLLILRSCNPSNVGRIALIYNFAHNSLIHLNRLIFTYDDHGIEISVIFMMTMCKFTGFAYAFQDGQISHNDKKYTSLKEEQKYVINSFTSFEYFSYVFFLPSCLCGPFIEFRDFINFMKSEENYKNIPSTIVPSIKRLLNGVILFIIYSALKGFSDVDKIIDEQGQYTFWERALFFVVGSVHELKYVGAFCLAEAGIIASGISYAGSEEEFNKVNLAKNNNLNNTPPSATPQTCAATRPTASTSHPPVPTNKKYEPWGYIKKISIINLQLIYKPSEFFHHWNISIHFYLRRYVYFRLLPLTNATFTEKQFASSITFFYSALWHGFHPTYFISFAHFYLLTLLENNIIKLAKIYEASISNTQTKIFIFVVRCIVLFILVPYHCLMFICLDVTKLLQLLKSVNAFVSIAVIFLNIMLFLILKLTKKGVKKEDSKKAD